MHAQPNPSDALDRETTHARYVVAKSHDKNDNFTHTQSKYLNSASGPSYTLNR